MWARPTNSSLRIRVYLKMTRLQLIKALLRHPPYPLPNCIMLTTLTMCVSTVHSGTPSELRNSCGRKLLWFDCSVLVEEYWSGTRHAQRSGGVSDVIGSSEWREFPFCAAVGKTSMVSIRECVGWPHSSATFGVDLDWGIGWALSFYVDIRLIR